MKRFFAALLLCTYLILPLSSHADTLGIAYISVESVNHVTGEGVVRVMAVRGNGTFACGQTVVVLHDPCNPLVANIIADQYIDYGLTPPGQPEDGAFFAFTVPNPGCYGRYLVGVSVFDSGGSIIQGSTTFKY